MALDAIIRKDFELLYSLFKPLSTSGCPEKIGCWFVRGQVLYSCPSQADTAMLTNILYSCYLIYAMTTTRLPQLLGALPHDGDEETYPDAS